jgi:hypothetical protein
MTDEIDLDRFDQWLPADLEQVFVERLLQVQPGLTRRRACCFIRIWVYLMLKQSHHLPKAAIQSLKPIVGMVPCTHREAAALFYANGEKGSERAAGMMIDQLVKAGLVEKSFDGNTIVLRLRTIPELLRPVVPEAIATQPDDFNPRTDAVPVANCIAQSYSWLTQDLPTTAHKITKLLRQWSQSYPAGMRVLRRQDNQQPIGFFMLFPVASVSEGNFFRPPSSSLYLSTVSDVDPITMATPGDDQCLTVFVRSWKVDELYLNADTVYQFLEDSKATLMRMRADFPNLCDLYTLPIHPIDEALATLLGFQKTVQDPHSYLCWMYMALDQLLELDIARAIAPLGDS